MTRNDGRGAAPAAAGHAHQARRLPSPIVYPTSPPPRMIAATPPNGRITIEIKPLKQATRITIADSGAGMTQAELARALEGLRATGDGMVMERRQGLGLPLARRLIDAHGGTLELASRKGSGTTATVTLP